MRTLEEFVKEAMGALLFVNAQLQAEIEQLRAEIARLKAEQ